MIPLYGRATTSGWTTLARDVWPVADTPMPGAAVRLGDRSVPGGELYLSSSGLAGPGPTVHLPAELAHVEPGDVVVVSADGTRVAVAWKASATHNSLLLTERCENYCIMCSQPPKAHDDSYLYARAKRVISALPGSARAVGLTGGEPTTDPEAFLDLLEHCARVAPRLEVHVLSNGRRFADPAFAAAYARVPVADLMVGIPLYSSEPARHDFVVQARGAFDEAVKGILNLAAAGARVEIRVVVQQQTVPVLTEIALFISRNLPFVEQVALMGLEMTGLARPNAALVWVDPVDYRNELRDAFGVLAGAGIRTLIYNHQLCVLDRELWPAAVRSISDWKNDYPALCGPCAVRDSCAGVFTTSGGRLSRDLRPIRETVHAGDLTHG